MGGDDYDLTYTTKGKRYEINSLDDLKPYSFEEECLHCKSKVMVEYKPHASLKDFTKLLLNAIKCSIDGAYTSDDELTERLVKTIDDFSKTWQSITGNEIVIGVTINKPSTMHSQISWKLAFTYNRETHAFILGE